MNKYFIDTCQSSPCKNSGKCFAFKYYYECQCTKGWEGYDCNDRKKSLDE